MASKKLTSQPVRVAKIRRKAEDERKQLTLRIRVSEDQRRILATAADKAGLDVSSWLRAVGIERARALGVE